MNIKQTRQTHTRAFYSWVIANRIRRALTRLTGCRSGPGKAWADEQRVLLRVARRGHVRALRESGYGNTDE